MFLLFLIVENLQETLHLPLQFQSAVMEKA